MAEETAISWADSTANLWMGCQKVSPACDHCYAEDLVGEEGSRFKVVGWGPRAPRKYVNKGWQVLRWAQRRAEKNGGRDPELGRRRRVFVNSLSDFFDNHESVVWREPAFEAFEAVPDVTVMLLTKRPQNIARMVPASWLNRWPEHVWVGTTVENQEEARRRIGHLIALPARVRFLSCEPLLGSLQLSEWLHRIEWLLVGGESGTRARAMPIDLARSLLFQCGAHEVAFHMKQLSEADYPTTYGDFETFPPDLQVRQFPDDR